MKKYMAPSVEEIKLVTQNHIASDSVDGKGYVDTEVPTAPPRPKS